MSSIVLAITHARQIPLFVEGPFFHALVENGYGVVLVTIGFADQAFIDRVPDKRAVVGRLHITGTATRFDTWSMFTRQRLESILTDRIAQLSKRPRVAQLFSRLVASAASKWRRHLSSELVPVGLHDALFEEFAPAAVVIPGCVDYLHMGLLADAKRWNVPALGIMDGWEEPSSGVYLEFLSGLAVWSRQQEGVANRLLGSGVHRIGCLCPDDYRAADGIEPRSSFLRSLDLDPSRPLITLFTGGQMPSTAWGGQEYLLRDLLDAMIAGALSPGAQIMLCPHPDNHLGPYVKYIGATGVHFEQSQTWFQTLGWMMDGAQSRRRRNIVYHSDIIVSPPDDVGLVLQAAILGTRHVIAAYNRVEPSSIDWAYAKLANRDPFSRLPVAQSRDELFASLAAPSGSAKQGAPAWVSEWLDGTDDIAWQRLADLVLSVGRRAP